MVRFMLRRYLTLCAVALLLALPYQSVSRQHEAWFGRWTLDLKGTTSPAYKRVVTRIEPWEDGLRVTYEMVGVRGGITHMEWTGKFDGKDYPMQGVDYEMTNAYRKIDSRSYEIAIKIDGIPTATARVTVSSDGSTLTVATAEHPSTGQAKTTTTTYQRLGN